MRDLRKPLGFNCEKALPRLNSPPFSPTKYQNCFASSLGHNEAGMRLANSSAILETIGISYRSATISDLGTGGNIIYCPLQQALRQALFNCGRLCFPRIEREGTRVYVKKLPSAYKTSQLPISDQCAYCPNGDPRGWEAYPVAR